MSSNSDDRQIDNPFDQGKTSTARARGAAEPPPSMRAPDRASPEDMTKGKTRRRMEVWLLVPLFVGLVGYGLWPHHKRGAIVPKAAVPETAVDNGQQIVGVAQEANVAAQASEVRAEQKRRRQAGAAKGGSATGAVRTNPGAAAEALVADGGDDGGSGQSPGTTRAQAEANKEAKDEAQKAADREAEIAAAPLQATGVEVLKGDQSGSASQSPAETAEQARDRSLQQLIDSSNPDVVMDKAAKLATSYGGQGGGATAAPLGKAAEQDKWFASQKADGADVVSQHEKAPGYLVSQGTPVRTVLITGLDTDTPGMVTAQVTSDVYDSLTGSQLLIPKGSRVIGEYNHDVKVGQDRVLVALTRLIRPDGSWIDLSGAPGAEMDGGSGLAGDVNNHFFKIFGSALIIGAATLLLDKSQQTVTVDQGLGTTQMGGTIFAQTLQQVVTNLLARNQNIPPTITRDGGTEFIFMVRRDMSLTPYQRS